MKKVKIQKHDNCFTYALKRADVFFNIFKSSDEWLETQDIHQVHDPRKLRKGDILLIMLDKDEREVYELANEIDSDGKIIWSDVEMNKHFMVYEGDGMVSEAVHEPCGLFSLQIRPLEGLRYRKLLRIKLTED